MMLQQICTLFSALSVIGGPGTVQSLEVSLRSHVPYLRTARLKIADNMKGILLYSSGRWKSEDWLEKLEHTLDGKLVPRDGGFAFGPDPSARAVSLAARLQLRTAALSEAVAQRLRAHPALDAADQAVRAVEAYQSYAESLRNGTAADSDGRVTRPAIPSPIEQLSYDLMRNVDLRFAVRNNDRQAPMFFALKPNRLEQEFTADMKAAVQRFEAARIALRDYLPLVSTLDEKADDYYFRQSFRNLSEPIGQIIFSLYLRRDSFNIVTRVFDVRGVLQNTYADVVRFDFAGQYKPEVLKAVLGEARPTALIKSLDRLFKLLDRDPVLTYSSQFYKREGALARELALPLYASTVFDPLQPYVAQAMTTLAQGRPILAVLSDAWVRSVRASVKGGNFDPAVFVNDLRARSGYLWNVQDGKLIGRPYELDECIDRNTLAATARLGRKKNSLAVRDIAKLFNANGNKASQNSVLYQMLALAFADGVELPYGKLYSFYIMAIIGGLSDSLWARLESGERLPVSALSLGLQEWIAKYMLLVTASKSGSNDAATSDLELLGVEQLGRGLPRDLSISLNQRSEDAIVHFIAQNGERDFPVIPLTASEVGEILRDWYETKSSVNLYGPMNSKYRFGRVSDLIFSINCGGTVRVEQVRDRFQRSAGKPVEWKDLPASFRQAVGQKPD